MSDRNPLGNALAAIHDHARNGVEARPAPRQPETSAPAQPSRFRRAWLSLGERFERADSLTQIVVASGIGVAVGLAVNVALRVGIAAIKRR